MGRNYMFIFALKNHCAQNIDIDIDSYVTAQLSEKLIFANRLEKGGGVSKKTNH
jgi:hypothetical protein